MMNIDDIKKAIPHRYPFLMVDRVLEVEPGKFIKALKNITVNEPFFNGHFPQKPVMPGVLMVEALAQTAGLLIMKTLGEVPEGMFYLAGVDKARFKRLVVPGDQLILEAVVTKNKSDKFWKFETRALVDGELACTAEITNVRGDV